MCLNWCLFIIIVVWFLLHSSFCIWSLSSAWWLMVTLVISEYDIWKLSILLNLCPHYSAWKSKHRKIWSLNDQCQKVSKVSLMPYTYILDKTTPPILQSLLIAFWSLSPFCQRSSYFCKTLQVLWEPDCWCQITRLVDNLTCQLFPAWKFVPSQIAASYSVHGWKRSVSTERAMKLHYFNDVREFDLMTTWGYTLLGCDQHAIHMSV